MLFKKIDDEDWKWESWRYWCECLTPDHVLGFDATDATDASDNQDFEIYITSNPNMTLWRRISNSFKMLFGKEVCYMSISINNNDRKELAAAIAGSLKENSNY